MQKKGLEVDAISDGKILCYKFLISNLVSMSFS